MREEEQIARLKLQEEIRRAAHDYSPRWQRARRFTSSVMLLMRDFIPQDRDCTRRLDDYLTEVGFQANAEFVNVPPEWDALNKLQIERAMLDKKMQPIVLTPVE